MSHHSPRQLIKVYTNLHIPSFFEPDVVTPCKPNKHQVMSRPEGVPPQVTPFLTPIASYRREAPTESFFIHTQQINDSTVVVLIQFQGAEQIRYTESVSYNIKRLFPQCIHFLKVVKATHRILLILTTLMHQTLWYGIIP